jgi:hypothetical protein
MARRSTSTEKSAKYPEIFMMFNAGVFHILVTILQ